MYGYAQSAPLFNGIAPFGDLTRASSWIWTQSVSQNRLPTIPVAMTGWDPRPWNEREAISRDMMVYDRSPRAVASFVRQTIALASSHPALRVEPPPAPPMVLLEAWNELGEGSYLLPTKGSGDSYTQALAEELTRNTLNTSVASALSASSTGHSTAVPPDVLKSPTVGQALRAHSGNVSQVGTGVANSSGVTVDGRGDVFVANSQQGVVKKISPPFTGSTNGAIEVVGPAFSAPNDIAFDTHGNMYVSLEGNCQGATCGRDGAIEKVSPSGKVSTVGSGFYAPLGIAIDATGDLFVADYNTDTVKKITPSGAISSVGSGFLSPTGVAVDRGGNVYVADYCCVRRVATDGTITNVGSGFAQPALLALDAAGDVYLTNLDYGTVVKVAPPFSGPTSGTMTTVASGFTFPFGLAVTPNCRAACNVFVSDLYGVWEVAP
ncbi:MAG: SMP-30/gluconolactonase/LRE family protein [Candidatus Eremiobacteraeota bacterium]|nr:SMP-30/gluconolactonase/LRE family protein [Candidatus Eremiobacteraeota bacterium]